MERFKIRIEWAGSRLSASEVVGELSQIHHGLPGLRSSDVGNVHGLEFYDPFWRRAKTYMREICGWLHKNGVVDSWVVVNGKLLEDFLEGVIGLAQRQLETAVRRIKSTRYGLPNPRAKQEREDMEGVLAHLNQILS